MGIVRFVLTIRYKIAKAKDHTDKCGRLTVNVVFEGMQPSVIARVDDWERLSRALLTLHVIDEFSIEGIRGEIEQGVVFGGTMSLTPEEFYQLDSDHFSH